MAVSGMDSVFRKNLVTTQGNGVDESEMFKTQVAQGEPVKTREWAACPLLTKPTTRLFGICRLPVVKLGDNAIAPPDPMHTNANYVRVARAHLLCSASYYNP